MLLGRPSFGSCLQQHRAQSHSDHVAGVQSGVRSKPCSPPPFTATTDAEGEAAVVLGPPCCAHCLEYPTTVMQ